MRCFTVLFAVLWLASCGVDGPPAAQETRSGVSVSGDARIGVVFEP